MATAHSRHNARVVLTVMRPNNSSSIVVVSPALLMVIPTHGILSKTTVLVIALVSRTIERSLLVVAHHAMSTMLMHAWSLRIAFIVIVATIAAREEIHVCQFELRSTSLWSQCTASLVCSNWRTLSI